MCLSEEKMNDLNLHKKMVLFSLWIFLVTILFTNKITGQELKMSGFRYVPLDISARENPVFDGNGDPCGLIKVRCGLKDIGFESDLGVQKITRKEGEYWIWIPGGTNKLTISLGDTVKYDFDLPQSAEEYKVYIFVVTVILPARIEYMDLPALLINSKPERSNVFLNNIFYGTTPLNISYYFDTLQLKIVKKTYETLSREIYNTNQNQEIFLKLRKDPSATRFFISFNVDPANYEIMNPGISFGLLGKTGFVISLRPGMVKPDFDISLDERIADTSQFYLNTFSDSKFILKKFELFGGLSKRVFKDLFITVGFGYWEHKMYQKLTYNQTARSIQEKKYYIAEIENNREPDIAGASFNIQLYYRLFNSLLINLESTVFGMETDNNSDKERTPKVDIKIGLGYSF
jgi:hypothetical protein